MKYHPSFWGYAIKDYKEVVDIINQDITTSEKFFETVLTSIAGYAFLAAVPTIFLPYVLYVLYSDWRDIRKTQPDVFIDQL